jgi:preprotein translocase subunit SecF
MVTDVAATLVLGIVGNIIATVLIAAAIRLYLTVRRGSGSRRA